MSEEHSEGLKELFHKVKGASGMYGFPTISHICSQFEVAIQNEVHHHLPSLLESLKKAVQEALATKEKVLAVVEEHKTESPSHRL